MEKDFEAKWLAVIGNKENALVTQMSGLETRFVYLLAMIGVVANHFINYIKLKYSPHIKADQGMASFFVLVLIAFCFLAIKDLAEVNRTKCKQNKVKDSHFRNQIIPYVLFIVGAIFTLVNIDASSLKVNDNFLLIPPCICFLGGLVQIIKPGWFDWYLSNSNKKFLRYDIYARIILILIFAVTIFLLMYEYGLFINVWKSEVFLDLQCIVTFLFLLWIVRKAYDTQIVNSELQGIRNFQLSVMSNKLKKEEELKHHFVNVLSGEGA